MTRHPEDPDTVGHVRAAVVRSKSGELAFEALELDAVRTSVGDGLRDVLKQEMSDVAIAGAWSADAALANRMTTTPSRTVRLLEAGVAYPQGDNPFQANGVREGAALTALSEQPLPPTLSQGDMR